jgi:hypothetical protein
MSFDDFDAKVLMFEPTACDTGNPDTKLFYLPTDWVSASDSEFQSQVTAKLADVVVSAFGDPEDVEIPLGQMITELLFNRVRPNVVSRSVPFADVLYNIDMWFDSVVLALKVRFVAVPRVVEHGLELVEPVVRPFVVRQPVVEYTDSPHIIKVRFPEGWGFASERLERDQVANELASVMVAEFDAESLRLTFREMVVELLFGVSGWLGWRRPKPDIVARLAGNTNIKFHRESSMLRVRVTDRRAVNFVPRDNKAEASKIVTAVLDDLVERHPELKTNSANLVKRMAAPGSEVAVPAVPAPSEGKVLRLAAPVVVAEELTEAQLTQVAARERAANLSRAVDTVFRYIQRLGLNKLTPEQEFELERLGVTCRTIQGLLADLDKVEDDEVKSDSLVTAEKVLGRIQSSVKALEKSLSDDVLRELKILERYVDMRDNGALLEE